MTAPTPAASPTTDPTGFASFKPRSLYTAYHVSDVDRSLAFYAGVLGMKEQMRVDLSATLHEVVLGFPDSKGSGVILMWDTARTQPLQLGDGYSRFIVQVSDVAAATAYVQERGARVKTPPTDAGPMRYSIVHDPDGYAIELLQLSRPKP